MRQQHTLVAIVSAALLWGCGGGDEGGPDKCSGGTTWDSQVAKCVPDGSVICGTGTQLDADSGTCVSVNPNCPAPNQIVGGDCVFSAPAADIEESADPEAPAQFSLPGVGNSVTLGGCINPSTGEIDLDDFAFQSDGNKLLKITAAGFGGLDAAFTVVSADIEAYTRFGVNFTGTGAERTVYLPPVAGGVFALQAADTRSLFFGEPAGSDKACYHITVEELALPTPTPLTGTSLTDVTVGDNTLFYSYTANGGDVTFSALDIPGTAILGDYVEVRSGEYFNTIGFGDGRAAGDPAVSPGILGINAGEEIIYVIDPVYNYGLEPSEGTFDLNVPVAALPTIGTSTTFDNDGDTVTFLPISMTQGDILEFDFATDRTILTDLFTLTSSVDGSFQQEVLGAEGTFIAQRTGYYYIRVLDADPTTAAQITLTNNESLTTTPAPLATGTNTVAKWHSFDPSANEWITLDTTDALTLTSYPYVEGLLQESTDSIVGPLTAQGLIFAGQTAPILVQSDITGIIDVAPRAYTDLGLVDEANPIAQTGTPIAATETHYYIAKAAPYSNVSLSTSVGYTISQYAIDETVLTSGETIDIASLETNYIAFSVTGPAGSYDLNITVLPPLWQSICPQDGGNGTAVTLSSQDEEVTAAFTLGHSFTMFGTAYTDFLISTNGWLTFNTAYAGTALWQVGTLPDATEPNSMIAPSWFDLDSVDLCVELGATETVVQWRGVGYGSTDTAEFQAIFNDQNEVSFIYGPGYQISGATIGAENAAGDMATSHDEAIIPNTEVELIQ